MRLIDADKIELDYSGLAYISHLDFVGTAKYFTDQIKAAPTVDAEPVKHGHWIMKKTTTNTPYTVCSHCNTSVKYNDEYGMVVMNLKGANYCPNCGAKMMNEVSE